MCVEENTGRKLAATPNATSTRGDAIPSRGPTTVAPAITSRALTMTTRSSVTCQGCQRPASIRVFTASNRLPVECRTVPDQDLWVRPSGAAALFCPLQLPSEKGGVEPGGKGLRQSARAEEAGVAVGDEVPEGQPSDEPAVHLCGVGFQGEIDGHTLVVLADGDAPVLDVQPA